uniref:Nuclear receptor domain-containing protein n=1 Tax=Meloidogyne incognita TaxID=6306 RepID=A0A914M5U7_MELIC
MELEQQTQILSPPKTKKRKTIPPELLVDIFKTINTYSNELSRDISKDPDAFYIKILLKGLWRMYAEKLMASSSIVYLTAGNAFRQCKRIVKKMSSGNEQTPIEGGEVQDLTTQPNFEFVANLADAVKFDDDESSNNEEHINYWKKNFLDLFKARKADQAKMAKMEETFKRKGDDYLDNEEKAYLAGVVIDNLEDDKTKDFWINKYMDIVIHMRVNEAILKAEIEAERKASKLKIEAAKKSFMIEIKKMQSRLIELDRKKIDAESDLQKIQEFFAGMLAGKKSDVSTCSLSPTSSGSPQKTGTNVTESPQKTGICSVCKASSDQLGTHYSAKNVCKACSDFFRRYKDDKKCNDDGNCAEVLKCPPCRYQKCLYIGMKLPTSKTSPTKRKAEEDFAGSSTPKRRGRSQSPPKEKSDDEHHSPE